MGGEREGYRYQLDTVSLSLEPQPVVQRFGRHFCCTFVMRQLVNNEERAKLCSPHAALAKPIPKIPESASKSWSHCSHSLVFLIISCNVILASPFGTLSLCMLTDEPMKRGNRGCP